MKNQLQLALFACAILATTAIAQATPPEAKHRQAQIRAMCQDKNARLMMIRELMSTAQGKLELAEMLKHDAEFRSYYEINTVNPG